MPSGILLLDKPRGLSSNAALQRVRALFLRQKAGHVGSLDPLATGMLPICLGEATKVAGQILAGRKRYRFTVALGAGTATGDAEGAVTTTTPVPPFDRAGVDALLARFRGSQTQIPPMYSALKRAGQPLYRLARAGVTVARAARDIELFELALLALGPASLELEALCSKGTYIRVLAEDLAAALGTCGHVTAVRLPRAEAQRLLSGQSVMAEVAGAPVAVRLYDEAGTFLGLGDADGRGAVRPRRLLNAAS